MKIEIVLNCAFEFGDALEHAAADAITCDQAEEAFDLIEPGRRSGGEMHVEARMFGQPCFDRRMLMGGIVVGDQVQVKALGRAAVDEPKEFEPFLVTMTFHAFADHPAGGDIKGRKQGILHSQKITTKSLRPTHHETFNILKNNGYHLEHNFGHGKQNLAMTFAALNLLAFAFHTVCDCLEDLWNAARQAKRARNRKPDFGMKARTAEDLELLRVDKGLCKSVEI